MGLVAVETKNIVERIAKEMKFLQPVYEAITNSLEANAKHIVIDFIMENCLEGIAPKVNGFSIMDDGDGFTKINCKAFCELWTKNKFQLGCKGSGRFTWLSVYEKINIESDVVGEQQKIFIPFSIDFKPNDIIKTSAAITKNCTIITFSNVTTKYFDLEEGRDKRIVSDLNIIKESIAEYLLIKLFLLKKAGKEFQITLKLGSQQEIINNATIPNLRCKTFEIYSDITNESYWFNLYYLFRKDNKNSKKVFYCANSRATKNMDDDALGFSCGLPNGDSFVMLLCSTYFDDKDNDSRNDLVALSYRKQASMEVPLLFSDINPEMKKAMYEIIIENYPEINELNKKETEKAIETAPHLATFIKRDNDVIQTEKSLLVKANDAFNKAKTRIQASFQRLLISKDIRNDDFQKVVGELSLIAAAELGEYIMYRESIIKALDNAIEDTTKKEKFIHDIFMPMRTASFEKDEDKHLLSNLWLLDDKFMTYTYAASDETVEAIKTDIEEKNSEKFKDRNRPDISIFFNDMDNHKNLVMIEFKGANADKYEKKKALTELPDDVAIIKKHIPDIDTVWSYIVTVIDEEFKFSIGNQDFKELFTADSSYCAYYKYFSKQNAHEYILDLKTITTDAFARNKIFMDILKKQ